MKLPSKLNARLSLLLLVFGMVLIAANGWRNQNWIRERRIMRFESDALEMGVRLSGMMQHYIRRDLITPAELEMSYAATTPTLDLGLVCDASDKVRFATRLEWVGTTMSDTPLREVMPLIKEVRTSMRPRVLIDRAQNEVIGTFPFYGAYQSRDRGLVVLRFDMKDELRQAARDALWESATQACALLALCLLLWLTLDHLVTRRVQELASYAQAVGGGADEHERDSTTDELSVVERSIEEAVTALRATELRLVEAAEAERRRIGADLHDDVCQRLSAVQLKAGVLESTLTREGHAQSVVAGGVAEELAKATGVVRGFAHGLAPMLVQKGRLAESLHELATTLSESFALRCECTCELGENKPAVWVDTHVYRIVQELATNAARHARPALIDIAVKIVDKTLSITVANDGKNYEPRAGGGIGLDLVAQRVRALGGQWNLARRDDARAGSVASCTVALTTSHFTDDDPEGT